MADAPEVQDHYTVSLRGGRSVTLTREAGAQAVPRFRVAVWSEGMQAGGFSGTTWELAELFLAIEKIGAHVRVSGLPGE